MNNSTNLHRLLNVLESGEVQRFHAVPSVPSQSVAQHSWGVAVIARYLVGVPNLGEESAELVAASLLHDTGEIITGDIPFTAKRECFSHFKEALDAAEEKAINDYLMPTPLLNASDTKLLKMADMLEGMRWANLNERPCALTGAKQVCCKWAEALHNMFCQPEVLSLKEDVLSRAYGLYAALAPLMKKDPVYDSWAGFKAIYHREKAL